MPRSYPFDRIPDGCGGVWKLVTWECHLCGNNNWVSDGNRRWNYQAPEKCRTGGCFHIRCIDCYDCNEDDVRLQFCDGAILLHLRAAECALKYQEIVPLPNDKRLTFPCPLQSTTGCAKFFLTTEHASHHAELHKPVIHLPCIAPGCKRHFTRPIDLDLHAATHPVRTVPCSVPGCDQLFETPEAKTLHLQNEHTPMPLPPPLPPSEARFPCLFPDCERVFASQRDGDLHYRIHVSRVRIVCPVEGCGLSFSKVADKDMHVRIRHPGFVSLPCPFEGCEARFKNLNEKYKHLETHFD